jgi:uncharacterized protein YdhG (YjbR/CyaY superfamily)
VAATKTATKTAPKRTEAKGIITAEEKAAMRELVRERKGAGEGEAAVLAKIKTFKGSDRDFAERIHAVVTANGPELTPKLWYGMPAYAKDGKVICFFQDAAKFKARYATFGFNDGAKLDEGGMWPTSFALTKLTPAEEAKIGALVKKAVR